MITRYSSNSSPYYLNNHHNHTSNVNLVATLSTNSTYKGFRTIVLEKGSLRVSILPDYDAKIFNSYSRTPDETYSTKIHALSYEPQSTV